MKLTTDAGSYAVPGSADDHSGVRRIDVVRYLRAEALRDVPDQWWEAEVKRMMRVLADYLDRTQSLNAPRSATPGEGGQHGT